MSYQAAVERLATSTQQELERAWHDLPPELFAAVGAALLVRANAEATALGDAGLAAALTVLAGRDVLPLGLGLPAAEPDRLATALRTLTDDLAELDAPPIGRVSRLGRAEPMRAAQAAWHQGMVTRQVPGWTRQASGNSCAACVGLADGTVLSTRTPMWNHPGCDCIAQPTTRTITRRTSP